MSKVIPIQNYISEFRSDCPIASCLDIFGDKWTLLIIRDMLNIGKKQYGDFLESDERISTNILADRLKKLESHGLISKKPYQSNPVRYEYHLTDKGMQLEPILTAIQDWGLTHIENTRVLSAQELEEQKNKYR